MKFYYQTKSKGRAGCGSCTWRVTDEFETKKALKARKAYGRTTVQYIHTEAELVEKWGAENAQKIMETAKPW